SGLDGSREGLASEAGALDAADASSADAFDVGPMDPIGGRIIRLSVSSAGTEANGPSESPAISGDGLRVVFVSSADNLAPNDTNHVQDIFLRDRVSLQTTRVSSEYDDSIQADTDCFSPDIGADGHSVVFTSATDRFAT